MFKNIQTNFKLKSLVAIFLTPVLLSGFFVSPARAEQANHIVISEIQAGTENGADDEFVELYNPTNQEIDLAGWELRKKNSSGNENNLVSSKKFVGIIKAKHFFLIAHENYKGATAKDLIYSVNSNNLSYDNNSVILYDSSGQIVDEKAWVQLLKGQSLERKAWNNGICVSSQGDGEFLGNGCDTDGPNDFEIGAIPNPQNSASLAEPFVSPSENVVPGAASNNSTNNISPNLLNQSSGPVAEAGEDKEGVIGEIMNFDGSDSFDPDGKELSYGWSFGDGKSGRKETAEHAYNASGEYTAVLKVSNGIASGEDSLKVKVSEPEFSDKIILSEILPNPKGPDKDGEWIELANIDGKRVNLHGWILEAKNKSGGNKYVFSGDNFIEPNGYLLIKRSQSNLVLANAGGEVNLLLPPDKNLSSVSYGAAKEGESYALINGVWKWTSSITPGEKNTVSQAVTKSANKTSGGKTIAEAGKENAVSETAIADNAAGDGGNGISEANISGVVVTGRIIEIADSVTASPAAAVSENSAVQDNSPETSGENLMAAEAGAISSLGNTGEPRNENSSSNGVKNNPWFWGDMALSALSLFLVWRYQELKKRIK